MTRSFVFGMDIGPPVRSWRDRRPLDDIEDTVSREFVSFSELFADSCTVAGMDGIPSPGAKSPFLVVVPDAEREPSEKRFFALGAEATRRIKREAFWPMDLGERGPDRDVLGDAGPKDCCEAPAVCARAGARPSIRLLSDLEREREEDSLVDGSFSDDGN